MDIIGGKSEKLLKRHGFSLLEMIIVIAILAVISTISFGVYYGFIRQSEIDQAYKNIVFDLRYAQAKAMSGEGGKKWGIHFVNGADDYYEIFSTLTDYSGALVDSTIYLQDAIYFTDPAISSNIIFEKINGTTASNFSVTVASSGGQPRSVYVSTIGKIY